MKRILVYGMTNNKGGIESFLMNYYRNFDGKNLKMDFVSNTGKLAYQEEIESLGGIVYQVTSKGKNPFKFKKELNKILKENAWKYDTIWVNLCDLANIDYLKLAKKYNISNRIIHSHNAGNMAGKVKEILHKKNRNKIMRYATEYWSCSEEASKWFYNEKIIEGENYKIINNAIDLKKFEYKLEVREKYREKLELTGKNVLINIGRFNIQKNHKFLLEVVERLNREDCILLLVGSGELESEIKKIVQERNLETKVKFLGMRDDVDKLLQASDIFLMPSIFEGLPVSVIEAQNTGIKCILSDKITREVGLIETMEFIEISSDKANEKWTEAIEKTIREKSMRKPRIKEIQKSGFDIVIEAKKVEKIFLQMGKNK